MGSRPGAGTGPRQPAFQLTLPATPPPRERPAPVAKEQPTSATQQDPASFHDLQSVLTVAGPSEDPDYGRMTFEMRESMKRSKATVVFSPTALSSPTTPSPAANTHGGVLSNKRKAQSGLEEGSAKRSSSADNIGIPGSPEYNNNQKDAPQDHLVGLLRPGGPDGAFDWRVVRLLQRAVSVTVKKTIKAAEEENSIFGIPIWPGSFPLKPEGHAKAREMYDVAIRHVFESILGSSEGIPVCFLRQSTDSASSGPSSMTSGSSSPAQSTTPNLAAFPATAPVVAPISDITENTGIKNSTAKGLCVPNVVEVNGGVGLVINGGRGFVPLPGLPKSHQKKAAAKTKLTEQAAFNPIDSAALQDALRSNDKVKAQEIASRIFPQAPASAPATPPKAPARKRAPAKAKKTEEKKTANKMASGKKNGNGNQPSASADSKVTTSVTTNEPPLNQAGPGCGNFLPLPPADPFPVNQFMGAGMDFDMDNQITDETLRSFDLDQLMRDTLGASGAGGSSANGYQDRFDGNDFDFNIPSVQSPPGHIMNLATEVEPGNQRLASDCERSQTLQQSNDIPVTPQAQLPVNHFGEQFHVNLDEKLNGVDGVVTTCQPTQSAESWGNQFYPFPTAGNVQGAVAVETSSLSVPATNNPATRDTTEQTSLSCGKVAQNQTSTSAGEATQLKIPTIHGTANQPCAETAPSAYGTQTPAKGAAKNDNTVPTAMVADTAETGLFADLGLGEHDVEDWVISQYRSDPESAIPSFIQDQAIKFDFLEALADFCNVYRLPNPEHPSFKQNALAEPHTGRGRGRQPPRIWRSQDNQHRSDLPKDDILWMAAVYAWNCLPARYRFSTVHISWRPIQLITPRFLLTHGPVITLYHDPKLAPRDPLRAPTNCSWDDVKCVARSDGVFAGLVWDVHPGYRQRVTWDTQKLTFDVHLAESA